VIDARRAHLLGTHVRDGSERPRRRPGERDIRQLRDAEVEDLHHAVVGDEHVGRLDVAVHDPTRVRVRETACDLHRDAHRLAERERPARDAPLQRLAVVERHREIQLSVIRLADLVHGAHVGMLERRDSTCLVQESLGCRAVRTDVSVQELERDRATEPLVDRPVHHAHATAGDACDDAISPDHATRAHRHLGPVQPCAER
jgi:hypothetical protein